MLFASFFASKWRWLAYALAIIFAVLLLTQAADYASTRLARRHLRQQVDASQAAADRRAATEPARLSRFDSTLFVRIGEHRELMRQAHLLKKTDDSLTARLPAAPALPADPARQ